MVETPFLAIHFIRRVTKVINTESKSGIVPEK
jgi:hypothetical protein